VRTRERLRGSFPGAPPPRLRQMAALALMHHVTLDEPQCIHVHERTRGYGPHP
jgi:hypothetical protein